MQQCPQLQRIVATVAGLTLLVAACGSDDSGPTAQSPVSSRLSTDVTTTVPLDGRGEGGWIDGEPKWFDSAASDVALAAESGAVPTGREASDGDASFEVSDLEAPMPVEPDGGIGDGARPLPVEGPPVDAAPLRAGSVDDNVDFSGFLGYLERIAELGVTTRELDPTGRSIITVVDDTGRPVPGVAVEVATGNGVITLRTTADGTVRFHPAFYGLPVEGQIEFVLGGPDSTPSSVASGEMVTVVAPSADIASPVPLDVLFLLDATGSMGDEIDRLKQTIDTVAERLTALDPAPDVRFAMTLYRDEGDAFVTANYDFTRNIAEFQAALADVIADGGNDYPEALDEGLADALAKPAWRDPAEAVQLIFVVADAPPQVNRRVETPYTDSIRTAIERGIKIFPVASSESDDQAEAVFRQMAQATGAPFVFLSNGAAGAATGGSTDIASTDYEELALDELIVRLIAEELSDLQGDVEVTVPTTVAPVTTNPAGQ
jgi:hypothetical protein